MGRSHKLADAFIKMAHIVIAEIYGTKLPLVFYITRQRRSRANDAQVAFGGQADDPVKIAIDGAGMNKMPPCEFCRIGLHIRLHVATDTVGNHLAEMIFFRALGETGKEIILKQSLSLQNVFGLFYLSDKPSRQYVGQPKQFSP